MKHMYTAVEKFVFRDESEEEVVEEREEVDVEEDEEEDCDDPNDEDYVPSEEDDDDDDEEEDNVEEDNVEEEEEEEEEPFPKTIPSSTLTTLYTSAIHTFINIHHVAAQLQIWFFRAYERNTWISTIYTFAQNCYFSAAKLFKGCKVEPNYIEWICESSLVFDSKFKNVQLIEQYSENNTIETFSNMCREMQDVVNDFSYMHYKVKENLLVYKFNNYGYLVRTFIKDNQVSDTIDLTIDPILANVRFLSIQYIHPSMKEPLFLDIPRGMYYCGNQILSSAHILRILQYQSSDYVFNDNYTLLLLDENVKEINLRSNNYVCVEKDMLRISTVQP